MTTLGEIAESRLLSGVHLFHPSGRLPTTSRRCMLEAKEISCRRTTFGLRQSGQSLFQIQHRSGGQWLKDRNPPVSVKLPSFGSANAPRQGRGCSRCLPERLVRFVGCDLTHGRSSKGVSCSRPRRLTLKRWIVVARRQDLPIATGGRPPPGDKLGWRSTVGLGSEPRAGRRFASTEWFGPLFSNSLLNFSLSDLKFGEFLLKRCNLLLYLTQLRLGLAAR